MFMLCVLHVGFGSKLNVTQCVCIMLVTDGTKLLTRLGLRRFFLSLMIVCTGFTDRCGSQWPSMEERLQHFHACVVSVQCLYTTVLNIS